GVWRRILTDPATGAVLDVGRQRYAPPPELADHVIVRDRSCRFPTCTRPAETCDLDHTIPWERGGTTSAGNLGPLHRGHHNDKTHHRWRLDQPEPGRFVWTAPTGPKYDVDPEIVGLLPQPPPAPPDEDRPADRAAADPNPPPF
ncbi:MAG TPA: HNH endonuclease signature motif containing protein, partial [Jiangellaceae bacterium]|nr:HNH endonuclease signature motif containing protein [Jiangellaceae bacterium]